MDFNKQRMLRAGYITENSRLNREYKGYNKKSISLGDPLLVKSK